ncbi:MAG TPA: hypothetical protein VJS43_02350, partial [Candidatus Acidoferrales bacterium]|nr:hypothetical protein [Candidatus Acidoferrales bacterium]
MSLESIVSPRSVSDTALCGALAKSKELAQFVAKPGEVLNSSVRESFLAAAVPPFSEAVRHVL